MIYEERYNHAVEHTRHDDSHRTGGQEKATVILDELGLSMSTAVNAFLKALVREGGMPFEMKVKTSASDGKTVR